MRQRSSGSMGPGPWLSGSRGPGGPPPVPPVPLGGVGLSGLGAGLGGAGRGGLVAAGDESVTGVGSEAGTDEPVGRSEGTATADGAATVARPRSARSPGTTTRHRTSPAGRSTKRLLCGPAPSTRMIRRRRTDLSASRVTCTDTARRVVRTRRSSAIPARGRTDSIARAAKEAPGRMVCVASLTEISSVSEDPDGSGTGASGGTSRVLGAIGASVAGVEADFGEVRSLAS